MKYDKRTDTFLQFANTSISNEETSLEHLSDEYAFILCDIWGVLHNGETMFAAAIDALLRVRRRGLPVILITNAPRTASAVEVDLMTMGLDARAWDRILTSGDVTREHIVAGSKIFHIGPDRHHSLYEGLDIKLVAVDMAEKAVCTGLYNELTDQPHDYSTLLAQLAGRGLPFICVNPDMSVMHGTKKIWCAGAIANEYQSCGGAVEMMGKPFPNIYKVALKTVQELHGEQLQLKDGLAIGDGIHTDIEGARRNGIDALFITGGLHAQEYGYGEEGYSDKLRAFITLHRATPRAIMDRLRW